MLEDKAEAEVVVAVVNRVVVTVRHAAVPRIVVPAAATVHPVRAMQLSTLFRTCALYCLL